MKELQIPRHLLPLLEYTVADAVASLTRLRICRRGPPYLVAPRSPLVLEGIAGNVAGNIVTVRVTCQTWFGTTLILPLYGDLITHSDFVAQGDLVITYGKPAHHISLFGFVLDTKRIAPRRDRTAEYGPMRYEVRNRAR